MNKNTIIKLVKGLQVTQEELTELILDYVKFCKKEEPTTDQFQKIIQLFQMGVFTLENAINDGIKEHNLQVIRVLNNGVIIRTDVYEESNT